MSGPTFSLADVAALLEAATSGSKSSTAPQVLEEPSTSASSTSPASSSSPSPDMAQLLAAMAATTGAAGPVASPAPGTSPVENTAATPSQDSRAKSGVAALLPLLRAVNDLKRIRSAEHSSTWASRCFARSWKRILGGEEIERVALQESARAVCASRLADVDLAAMERAGLSREEALQVLERALEEAGAPLYRGLRERLKLALRDVAADVSDVSHEEDALSGNGSDLPEFARLLLAQPRAGATRAGVGRIVLEPSEMHGDHCAVVAVNGVLLAPLYGANVGEAFFTGLTHHFHNAWWPDAGEVGDTLVGSFLEPAMQRLREKSLAQLPEPLRSKARASLEVVYRADTAHAQAFQAADVLDRVLEMEWHARSASFTLSVALSEMDIVHPGPVQAFQQQVMRASELLP